MPKISFSAKARPVSIAFLAKLTKLKGYALSVKIKEFLSCTF